MNTAYYLPHRIAATGGAFGNGAMLLTDGHTPFVYLFDMSNGSLISKAETASPLLRILPCKGGFCGMTKEGVLKHLSSSFCEASSLDAPKGTLDIGVSSDGGTAAVTRGAVHLLGSDGVCERLIPRKNIISFTQSLSGTAEAYTGHGETRIHITSATAEDDAEVPPFLSFRTFMTRGADIFGLFGCRYVYNCILPLFAGGLCGMRAYFDKTGFYDLLRQ